MTPERYKRIKDLFHLALERPPAERPDFLAEACGNDAALLAKVEALLAADEQAGNFMDAPAYEVVAEIFSKNSTVLPEGERVGHYQIIALLGSGGMGDVYLAKDTRLGRKVALKFLPEYLTNDDSRVRRFKQEARAASALNHPNLLTIYEIEQVGGRYFIATEFVDGVTLRECLKGGQLKSSEALEIAAQIARALSKAHDIGIVHRDIKPENVMLDGEGRVKVLDFGLAKYVLPSNARDSLSSSTENAYTVPGVLMGTTRYMSPEQARGLAVDARTDIWSLGIVLYEMLTGHTPFNGQTASDILAAILEREPEPLRGREFEFPHELQRIVGKALQKEREKRYQTIKEMALDMEKLRRELDGAQSSLRATTLKADTYEPALARPSVSRSKSAMAFILAGVLLLVVAAFIGTRMWRPSSPESAEPPAASPPVEPERKLAYWILVQKYRNGRPFQDPFRLGEEINFEKDYRLRLNLDSEQDGHLYILNEGPAEANQPSSFVILFPSSTTNNGLSLLGAGKQIQIPERSWLQFDAEQGVERIWLVWSSDSIPTLEALKGFANPRDRGLIGDPDLNNAVRDFLQAHQSPRPALERDGDKKEVVIKATGAILVHLLKLEHH